MAACSDRAAASISAFEETDMTTSAAANTPRRSFRERRLSRHSSSSSSSSASFGQRAGLAADRRQFPELPDLADDAVAEPEPAQIRSTPTSSPSNWSNSPASSNSSTPTTRWRPWYRCSRPRNRPRRSGIVGKTAMVKGNTAPLSNSSATWAAQHSDRLDHVDVSIASSTGQTVYSPAATPSPPATTSRLRMERPGQ